MILQNYPIQSQMICVNLNFASKNLSILLILMMATKTNTLNVNDNILMCIYLKPEQSVAHVPAQQSSTLQQP
jgi:hypothetical protein